MVKSKDKMAESVKGCLSSKNEWTYGCNNACKNGLMETLAIIIAT